MPKPHSDLEHATAAVRYVKWMCPIGAATHEADQEKTRSLPSSIPWSNASVGQLRHLSKNLKDIYKNDVKACIEICERWIDILAAYQKQQMEKLQKNLKSGAINFTQALAQPLLLATICQKNVINYQQGILYSLIKIADMAIEHRCGNCQEQAALAFIYLLRQNITPLEFFCIANGDHAFVVIGRPKDSDEKDPNSWGDAIICEPWNGTAYKAKDYLNHNLFDVNSKEYPRLIYREERKIYYDVQNNLNTEKPVYPISSSDLLEEILSRAEMLKITGTDIVELKEILFVEQLKHKLIEQQKANRFPPEEMKIIVELLENFQIASTQNDKLKIRENLSVTLKSMEKKLPESVKIGLHNFNIKSLKDSNNKLTLRETSEEQLKESNTKYENRKIIRSFLKQKVPNDKKDEIKQELEAARQELKQNRDITNSETQSNVKVQP